MKFRLSFFLLLTAAIIFSSCQGCQQQLLSGEDALSTIPGDATMVVRIDVPSMMEKADFESIKQTNFYQDQIAEAEEDNPMLGDVMRDPEKSGVDMDQNAYLWYDVNPEAVEEDFMALVVSLKDVEAFETLLKSEVEEEPKQMEGFQLIEPDNRNAVAWNDKFAVFGSADLYLDMEPRLAKLFNTEKATSVAENENLQQAFGESHDITLWFNSNVYANNPQAKAALGLAEVDVESLKDNFIHGNLDFLQGEIVGQGSFFLHKELTKEIDLFFNDQVQANFKPYIPQEGLKFALTNAINIQGIDELLARRTQSKGFIDFSLKQYGITTEDITATFSGDILLLSYENEAGKNPGLFATQVKDRERLNKFLQLGLDFETLEQEGENRYKIVRLGYPGARNNFNITFSDGLARLLVTDDMIFISGSEKLLDVVANGGFPKAERANKEIQNLLSGNLFGAFLGIDAMRDMDASFENADVKDVTFEATREQVEMRIEMVNKDKNALRALIEKAEQDYNESNGKEKEETETEEETI